LGMIGLLLGFFASGIARAQTVSAADLTTRGRSLERMLELVLFPEGDPERSVLLVVDPSKALRFGKFPFTLRSVLRAHSKETKRLRLGMTILGAAKDEKPLPLGSDLSDIRKRAFASMESTRNVLRDVYTPLKRSVKMFAREQGRRTIVLFTQQNGDTEYNLEKVIAALKRGKIRVVVVTREVLVSDSYWYSYEGRGAKAPEGAYLGGTEAAFVEVPHGWIHQHYRSLTEVAGSGFGTWGLSRLAAGTGGTVEVFYTTESSAHRCGKGSNWVHCHFCSGTTHLARNQVLRPLRLKAVAPSLQPRRVVLKKAASDPYYKAVLQAWRAAYKAGLTFEEPTVRKKGGTLVPKQDREQKFEYYFGRSVSKWRRTAKNAKERSKAASRISNALLKSIASGDRSGGHARYRAIAELTHVMLRLTRLNLLYLEAFCRDVAPKITAKKAPEFPPPEVAVFSYPDKFAGVNLHSETIPLCHGVRPFFDLRMPGGAKLDIELRLFAGVYQDFLKRNAHTPFAVAISHMGIATYSVRPFGTGNPKGSTGSPRRSPNEHEKPNNETAREQEPERGESGSGSGSGGSDTPTSGG
jgi:hypothetical protein